MQIGRYKIDVIKDNVLQLDGGVVFSGMEKSKWSTFLRAKEDNKVPLGVNFILVRGEGINLLIDAGIGTKIREKRAKALGLNFSLTMEEHLEPYALTPDDINYVVFSHLHYDHCGGATELQGEDVVCVFKNALHIVQKEEWDEAVVPNEINKYGYCYTDYLPIQREGKLRLIKGNVEIFDNIFIEVTGGHTKGHQIVRICDGGDNFVYLADLCPTSHHLCSERRAAYDLFPLDVVEAKKRFLRVAARNQAAITFSHEQKGAFYKIEEANNCFNCTEYEA